jgi:ribosomal protein L37AE/L43A
MRRSDLARPREQFTCEKCGKTSSRPRLGVGMYRIQCRTCDPKGEVRQP